MALNLATFRARFPEFADADDALVQEKLDEAARRTPAGEWTTVENDAHAYLAAHLLALSPFGRDARLSEKDGSSTYGTVRETMEAERGPAYATRTT
jgi:hypothetical protein